MSQNERINDELLVIRVQEGDAEALSELVGRWQDRLWRLAWRLTDDEQAAWDVLQEAWIVNRRDFGNSDGYGQVKTLSRPETTTPVYRGA